jgi:hypothetical protein
MSISKELKDVQMQDMVRTLLEENPMYRDSDKKLSAKVWAIQMGGMDALKNLSAFDFLVEYTGGDRLYSQESIGRVRRLIQAETPHLRGEKWKDKEKNVSECKNALGYTP